MTVSITAVLIDAVIAAVSKSSEVLSEANSDVSDRIKTDVGIVLVTGNFTGDVITLRVKNVWAKSITKSDAFLETSSPITRIPNTVNTTANQSWSHTVEGRGSSWDQSVTVKVETRLAADATGFHKVTISLYNSVATEKESSI